MTIPLDPGYELIISELEKEIQNLKNILVCVTHHEGALEDYKKLWLPIVQEELTKRNKRYDENS